MKSFRSLRVGAQCGLLTVLLAICATGLPAQSPRTIGEKIFASNCAACHGADGRGGERAPNIATDAKISSLTEEDLESFIRNGVPGTAMPSFAFLGDAGLRNVLTYLRELQGKTTREKITGDRNAGHTLFFGKAGCSACHMVHGQGGFIASDLSNYGNGTSMAQVRSAIVTPAPAAVQNSEVVDVITGNGAKVHGVLRSEDNFTAIVQSNDGHYLRFMKAKVMLLHTGRTLMPTDYGIRLSEKELNDIVSYMVLSAMEIDPAEAITKRAGQ